MAKKKSGGDIKRGRPISAKNAARKTAKGKGVLGLRKGDKELSYVKTKTKKGTSQIKKFVKTRPIKKK